MVNTALKNLSATYIKCGLKRQLFKNIGMNVDNDLRSVGDAKKRGCLQKSGKCILALVNLSVAILATSLFRVLIIMTILKPMPL